MANPIYRTKSYPKVSSAQLSRAISRAMPGLGPGAIRRTSTARRTRRGYGSVARVRGAAVTGEMKYFDCDRTATVISVVTTTWIAGTIVDPGTSINLGAAGVVNPLCLFAPQVGAALNGRVGRKATMMKLKIRGQINVPAQSAGAVSDSATKVRLIVVMDKQTNAAQMTTAGLMNDATDANTCINSFQNPNNFGRFRVLKDKVITFGNASMTGAAVAIEQSGMQVPFKFTMNFKGGIPVLFNAVNGGTVADIIDNSLHICVGTNLGGAGTLAPTITYYTRVAYKD